jgi:hypothetical protein
MVKSGSYQLQNTENVHHLPAQVRRVPLVWGICGGVHMSKYTCLGGKEHHRNGVPSVESWGILCKGQHTGKGVPNLWNPDHFYSPLSAKSSSKTLIIDGPSFGVQISDHTIQPLSGQERPAAVQIANRLRSTGIPMAAVGYTSKMRLLQVSQDCLRDPSF